MTEQIEAFMIAARRLLHASLPVLLTFGPMTAAAQRPPVAPVRTVTDRYFDAGHGLGSTRSQREVELADIWSFLPWQLGDPAFQPRHAAVTP